MRTLIAATLLFSSFACGGGDSGPDADTGIAPTMDLTRDIVHTGLTIDVTALSGTAVIELAASASEGASFEVAGLVISTVSDQNGPLQFVVIGGRLDVGVVANADPLVLTIEYTFTEHSNFDGFLGQSTLVWPYYCGNLFPCKSDPADGIAFSLDVVGLPVGQVAVYPTEVLADAPSYMLAWAQGDYTYLDLGLTAAGTQVGVYFLPGQDVAAAQGGANLRDVVQWFEANLGPYPFGGEIGAVAVDWRAGAYGGMEHHPLWHIASIALGDEEVQAHEAAHGWFGNGVRIRCWEDFVLSEGTVSFLAARALGQTAGATAEQDVWASYQIRLDNAMASTAPKIAWPDSCGAIDILTDRLFTDIPYMKGAFFFRALQNRIGVAQLDAALSSFFQSFVGQAAGMQDLLDTVNSISGYDATVCANDWLRSDAVPTSNTCPQ